MIVIDAQKQVLGRMASKAAKQALLGEQVVIVNAEKAYVSGDPNLVTKESLDMLKIRNKGNVNRGPYHPKRPDAYVRKTIRGMIAWKTPRGKEAFKRVLVFVGVPEVELKKRNIPIPTEKSVPEKKLRRKITVEQICKNIGGSW